MKKLSEIIESYRVDRPDEWTMDALKRRAEALEVDRDLILAELQKANGIIIDLQHNPPKLAKEFLAEIKAEAGRAGFIEGANSMRLAFQYGGTYNTEDKANQYAAKIRNSGTWLKDSNVNGGKRQGGEK